MTVIRISGTRSASTKFVVLLMACLMILSVLPLAKPYNPGLGNKMESNSVGQSKKLSLLWDLTNLVPTQQPTMRPTVIPTTLKPTTPRLPSIRPTQNPTIEPTWSPTCEGCCEPGTFAVNYNTPCTKCPIHQYAPEKAATQCLFCPYPWTAVFEGEDACRGISLYYPIVTIVVLASFCTFFMVALIITTCCSHGFKMWIILALPTLDVISDLIYFFASDFHNPGTFVLCGLFLLFQLPLFVYILYEHKVLPRLWWPADAVWWLTWAQEADFMYIARFPCFGKSGRFPILSNKKHTNLRALLLELLVWLIAIAAQLVTIGLWVLILPVNVCFLLAWLLVGCLLHMTKLMTISFVWNGWTSVWTVSNYHQTDVDVDTEYLNICFQQQLIFESMTLLFFQAINNILLRRLSIIAIASMICTLSVITYELVTLRFYRIYITKEQNLRELTVGISTTEWHESLSFYWDFEVDLELEPAAKETKKFMWKREKKVKVVPKDDDNEVDGEQQPSEEPKEIEFPEFMCLLFDDFQQQQDTAEHCEEVEFIQWLIDEMINVDVTDMDLWNAVSKLVDDGVTDKRIFASFTLREFDEIYLTKLGITNEVIQQQLFRMHEELLVHLVGYCLHPISGDYCEPHEAEAEPEQAVDETVNDNTMPHVERTNYPASNLLYSEGITSNPHLSNIFYDGVAAPSFHQQFGFQHQQLQQSQHRQDSDEEDNNSRNSADYHAHREEYEHTPSQFEQQYGHGLNNNYIPHNHGYSSSSQYYQQQSHGQGYEQLTLPVVIAEPVPENSPHNYLNNL